MKSATSTNSAHVDSRCSSYVIRSGRQDVRDTLPSAERVMLPRDITVGGAIEILILSAVGGTMGAFLFALLQRIPVPTASAVVGLFGIAVAVLGWFMSSRLNADAQRRQLHRQVLNE